jgi:sodium/bile acid cotransporter 7
MKQFLVRRWFLLALAMTILVGFAGSSRWLPLVNLTGLRYGVVASVLFLMALPLEARSMWRTMRRPTAPLLAVLVNFLLLPLFAWGLTTVLPEWLLSREMTFGVMIAAATPCTLASASVWTRRAGGDDAVAIMVTVITNATCFLVTPFWLLTTTGQAVQISAAQMIGKLALVVVLPMTLAQLLRPVGSIGAWATERKVPLGVMAQFGVLTMIFFGSIQTGHRLQGFRALVSSELLLVLIVVIAIHVGMLLTGVALARAIGLDRRHQIAVGFSGSQKTLMVGLQMSMELGFNMIPMVFYHVSQLLIDTLFVDRFRRGERRTHGPSSTERDDLS